MAWVVDTCVLLDILEDDPEFGRASAACLKRYLARGLSACPVTWIELAPAFNGDFEAQREFLARCGIATHADFGFADTRAAHTAWNAYIARRRASKSPRPPKRPIADILIGAFACRFEGLITRNAADFQSWFPELMMIDPLEA